MRSGKDYISGLSDGRTVVVGGKKVNDLYLDPYLRGQVETVARYFDRQLSEQEICSVQDWRFHRRIGRAFAAPTNSQELNDLCNAFQLQAAASFGHMGRTPDFVASVIGAFAEASDFFSAHNPEFGRNISSYWKHCAESDLFLAHAAVNPSGDRSKSSSAKVNAACHLRVVERKSDGIVVSGAKLVGTLAPLADELLVLTLPGYRKQDVDFAVSFAVPCSAEGLYFICREPYHSFSKKNQANHPMLAFDEIDATCVFDNVFVPFERVFMDGCVPAANELFDKTGARSLSGLHGAVRMTEKAKLFVGVALEVARLSGVDRFLHVQEMLGEMINSYELVSGALDRCILHASPTTYGTMSPNSSTIQALRYIYPRIIQRFVEIIQIIGGGSLTMLPSSETVESEWFEVIEKSFVGCGGEDATIRLAILKLAWDIAGDAMGMRQLQYERYSNGDPVKLAALQFGSYPDLDVLRETARLAAGLKSC